MDIRADFSEAVVVDTTAEPWRPSPLPGVERRMLDRIGDEVARATSLVRYAPGSRFAPHVHGGGEEFLVLAGVFADEHGAYPAGTYVRNPPGSRHAPFSDGGCTIFVKLRQMEDDERTRVCIDTRRGAWRPDGALAVMPLFENARERVALMRWPAGAKAPDLAADGGVEMLVLDGVLADGSRRYPAGTWMRIPAGTVFAPTAETATTAWLKRGHLLTRAAPD